jgi:hypothetical protein
VRFLKNSISNSKLNVMFNLQQATSKLWGTNTILVKSGVGDVSTLTGVAFTKLPDIVYDQDGQMLQWEFDAINWQSLLASGVL